MWRGLYKDALHLLTPQVWPQGEDDLTIAALAVESLANTRLHDFQKAEQQLAQAEQLCTSFEDSNCGEILQTRGLMFYEQGLFSEARHWLERSLAFARSHGDRFLEATSLLNLAAVLLKVEHFDEAIVSSEASYHIATSLNARDIALVARDNVAWAYYKLGDSENALQIYQDAATSAERLGDFFNQISELTNVGYIYLDRGQFELAANSFQKALRLAENTQARQYIYNVRRVLARLEFEAGHIDQAAEHADRALQLARESKNHVDELYPYLVQGQIAARRGHGAAAEKTFLEVESDPACPVFLKWEAEHALATFFEDGKDLKRADRYYRTALATFEGARSAVRRDDSQLSFLTNGRRIYDDYIHFLVENGRTDDALRWADFSRARTLAEGLGYLPSKNATEPPPLRPQEIARGVRGALLFFWLGEKQSYLWTILPKTTQLTRLPPGPEIETVARRYGKSLSGPQSGSPLADRDGQWLYRTLIATIQKSLPKGGRVFIIPDSDLNNINFETLIAAEPAPHYWIEDATIANASSLRVLAAPSKSNVKRGHLLLIGDSVAPNEKYPELPRAAAQMESVASHFPTPKKQVFARQQATPSTYLGAHPERFSYIHFVAHGTASRLSPLDSAIILSQQSKESESFKLYARDIIQHPLRAELVTISACYGAGTRAYSGEGLVGLSWAFQRAGAHNVIGALWEASDSPTEQLMSNLYAELAKGSSPDAALRSAKLTLLHNTAYGNPFYWAPFQLYTQGRSIGSQ